jgi:hypothetical protein
MLGFGQVMPGFEHKITFWTRIDHSRWFAAAAIALVVALGAGIAASRAKADATSTQDDGIQIVLEGGAVDDLFNYFVGSTQPVFDIKVPDDGGPARDVQCGVTGQASGPCGTQQTSGCPAATACWRYAPTVPVGENTLYIDVNDQGGPSWEDTLRFTVDTTPPDTRIDKPPMNDTYDFPYPKAYEHPQFDMRDVDDNIPLEDDTLRCTLSSPSAPPGPWGSCNLHRLRLTGVYRLRVQALDILGRPDPTPEDYVFSPTPCRARVLRHAGTLRGILRRGLRVRLTCIQPGRFEVDLSLSDADANRYFTEPLLGFVKGRMRRAHQTRVVRWRTRRRNLPRAIFRAGRVRLKLLAGEVDYGAPRRLTLTVRG